MNSFTESIVEEAALAWLQSLGYGVLHDPDIAPGMLGAERSDPNYCDAVLEVRLRQALVRLNPDLPVETVISKHLCNAFKNGECDPGASCAKFSQTDGTKMSDYAVLIHPKVEHKVGAPV